MSVKSLASKRKIWVGTAAIAVLSTVALTACSPSGTSSTASTASASAASSSDLYAQLPDAIRQKGYIQAVAQIPAPPFRMSVNGSNTGFDIDLANAIGTEIGIPIKFDTVSETAQLIPSIQTNRDDMAISTALNTKDRQQQVSFVDYIKTSSGFVTYQSTGISQPSDLCGKTVVVPQGSNYASQLPSISTEVCGSDSSITPLPLTGGFDAYMQQVQLGRAVALITGTNFTSYQASQNADYKVIPGSWDTAYFGIEVGLTNTQLADVLSSALTNLKADGTYDALLTKYAQSDEGITDFQVNNPSAN